MGVNDKIFSQGKITKTLLKFAIPAMISLLVVEFYDIVDTIYAGRYIGSDAIGALTIAYPVQRFMLAIYMLISVGASTFIARNLGEKNYEGIKKTILNSIVITIVTLVTLSSLIYIFRRPFIMGLGSSENIYPLAESYISIILIGTLFQGLSIILGYMMNSLGDTKINLYANLIGALTNILFNQVFMAGLGMSVEGSAFATVISQFVVFSFMLYRFYKLKNSISLSLSSSDIPQSFSPQLIRDIFTIGFSTFVIEISDAVVSVILNNLLLSRGGDSALVMIGVISRISMMMFISIIGVCSSMQPIVAYNHGAKNEDRVTETLKISIKIATVFSLATWIVLMVFTPDIIGFFLKETELLAQTVTAFRICISILPSVAVYYIAIYYYQAIDDSKTSFILSVYRQIIVFIPAALVLINFFGVNGAWVSFPLSDGIAALSSILFMKRTLKPVPEAEVVKSRTPAGVHKVQLAK
ncbi:MAG: MATE family efflux transporter [Clostridiaceae bacterium]